MQTDTFSAHLDELLQSAFQSVLKIEERMLESVGQFKLTISEIHLLEAVAKHEGESMLIGELARKLSLTPPSVTVAVKKLEQKGLLGREKGAADGRTVHITLTEMGEKVNRVHHRFHVNMVRGIASDMTDQEKDVLLRAMIKLNKYFESRLIGSKGKGAGT